MTTLPVQPFLRYLEPALQRRGWAIEDLSEAIGCDRTTLRHAVTRGTWAWDTADKALSKLDLFLVWYTDPQLHELYWEGDPPPDPWTPVKCANPDCDTWMPLDWKETTGVVEGGEQTHYRRYCSNRCKQIIGNRRYRKRNLGKRRAYDRAYRRRKKQEAISSSPA